MEEEGNDKERLQTSLLSCVKTCQSRFGSRNELATELDPSVSHLCSILEQVLSHGLRSKDKKLLEMLSGGNNDNRFTLWEVVEGLLTSHEKERYEMLRQVWTDRGRGRAWLRSALNERSLERYISSLLGRPSLGHFYEPSAFLMDQEVASILPNVAAGLSAILFALSIDRPELNDIGGSDGHVKSAVSTSERVIEDSLLGKSKKNGKKVKRNVAKIISFGDEEAIEEHPQDDSAVSTSSDMQNELTSEELGEVECAIDVIGLADQDLSNSDTESKNDVEFLSHQGNLRPLDSTNVTDLIPLASGEEAHSSEDSISVPSFSEDAETGLAVTEIVPSESVSSEKDQKTVDILKLKLEKLQESYAVSSSQLTHLTHISQQKYAQQEQKIQELNRENELLKNQLRKYVNAVQMLKQEGDVFEGEELYQQKLVQVAEMHGELMELNDRLQRSIVAQESIIKRLYMELEAIRGPLLGPTEIEITCTQIISLWIPSVFLSGAQKRHHVYQVHLRIGNDEWNVYRRYSQFYTHYKQFRNQYPIASAFQFPPKKTIGYKDEKFVEERRIKLQQYLRRLLNHTVANNPQLANAPTRARLIIAIPLFGEPAETPRTPNPRSNFSNIATNAPQYSGL